LHSPIYKWYNSPYVCQILYEYLNNCENWNSKTIFQNLQKTIKNDPVYRFVPNFALNIVLWCLTSRLNLNTIIKKYRKNFYFTKTFFRSFFNKTKSFHSSIRSLNSIILRYSCIGFLPSIWLADSSDFEHLKS